MEKDVVCLPITLTQERSFHLRLHKNFSDWCPAVHGVSMSRTQLSTQSCILETKNYVSELIYKDHPRCFGQVCKYRGSFHVIVILCRDEKENINLKTTILQSEERDCAL